MGPMSNGFMKNEPISMAHTFKKIKREREREREIYEFSSVLILMVSWSANVPRKQTNKQHNKTKKNKKWFQQFQPNHSRISQHPHCVKFGQT